MNLASDMERWAKEAPDRVGLIFEDGREYTFREIDELSSKTANFLKSLGVQKGRHVCVYMQNSPSVVMIMFGLWKIGAVLVSINVMYQEDEIRHAITTSDTDIMFTTKDKIEMTNRLRDHLNSVIVVDGNEDSFENTINYGKGILDASPVCPSYSPEEGDEAAVLLTGGTTGDPKAVITTHAGWYNSLSEQAEGLRGYPGPYPIEKADRPPNIVPFPLFHGGGQQSLLFAYRVGRTVLLLERFKAEKYVKLIEKYRITSLVLMPTMTYDLVKYEGPVDFSFVRSLLSLGQELRPEIKRAFEKKYNIPILSNYGSTEVGHVAGWNMKAVQEGKWKPGSVGRLYPGVQVEIRDENDKKLPLGEIGEICVKSKVSVDGYAGDKEASEGLIKNGWVYTGDIGSLDEDNVLSLRGRKREMIKPGGFQVFPQEIEDLLSEHPKIDDVAIIGVPDDRLGEIPKAFIVLKERSVSSSQEEELEQEIIDYCRDNMAHFKAVRAVTFIDEIPRSDTGKIMKPKLKEMDEVEREHLSV